MKRCKDISLAPSLIPPRIRFPLKTWLLNQQKLPQNGGISVFGNTLNGLFKKRNDGFVNLSVSPCSKYRNGGRVIWHHWKGEQKVLCTFCKGTYKSLRTNIIKNRRLRVETEDNVFNADKSAGIDLEKMAEERDTYRSLVRKRVGNSPSLDVVYLASFAALTNAEFVLSGSVTDDDGALHSIVFRHACFSS